MSNITMSTGFYTNFNNPKLRRSRTLRNAEHFIDLFGLLQSTGKVNFTLTMDGDVIEIVTTDGKFEISEQFKVTIPKDLDRLTDELFFSKLAMHITAIVERKIDVENPKPTT